MFYLYKRKGCPKCEYARSILFNFGLSPFIIEVEGEISEIPLLISYDVKNTPAVFVGMDEHMLLLNNSIVDLEKDLQEWEDLTGGFKLSAANSNC